MANALNPISAPTSLPSPIPGRCALGLRRVAEKAARMSGRLRGKPDPSPWVMRPTGARAAPRYVDFLFALNYASPNARMVRLFQEAMAPLGLSILLVNDVNRDRILRGVQCGWLRPHVYLDLCSADDPRYLELLQACARQGVYTIAQPDQQAIWTIKASSHPRLQEAGLPLPPTVILHRSDPDRELTPQERAAVGDRCVIKPSFGVAARGTVLGVAPTAAAIAEARQFNRQDDWLIQKMISWTRCGPHAGYLRAYHLCGHRSILWWVKENGIDKYTPLTWSDLQRYDLLGALDLIDRIAEVSGMDFFSSEIAITADAGPDRLVLIDYLNDQCDMDPEPGPNKVSVPEEWVCWACARFAEIVCRVKQGISPQQSRTLWLASDSI